MHCTSKFCFYIINIFVSNKYSLSAALNVQWYCGKYDFKWSLALWKIWLLHNSKVQECSQGGGRGGGEGEGEGEGRGLSSPVRSPPPWTPVMKHTLYRGPSSRSALLSALDASSFWEVSLCPWGGSHHTVTRPGPVSCIREQDTLFLVSLLLPSVCGNLLQMVKNWWHCLQTQIIFLPYNEWQ